MIILGKNFWKIYLKKTNTNRNGLEQFLQICINTLDQIARRKKTYVAIICHFLIKNYLAHTQKKRNQEIVIPEKILSK